MALRIALVTPAPLDAPRGNAVTVSRIAAGLGARGLDVRVWQAGVEAAEHLTREHPNLIHAFHAYHSGSEASALAKACGAALVVTLTGTDVSEHLAHPSTARAVCEREPFPRLGFERLDYLRALDTGVTIPRASTPRTVDRYVIVGRRPA